MSFSLLKQIRPNFNRLFLASIVFWFFISAFALLIIFNSGTLSLNSTNDYLFAASTSDRKLADVEQRVHETNQLINDFANVLFEVNLSNLTKSKLLSLQSQLKNLKRPHTKNEKNKTTEMQIPSMEYEQNRRNIRQNIREFGNFVNSLLDKLEKGKTVNAKSARIFVNEQKDHLLNKIEMLADSDQNEEWRRNEIDSLSKLVQDRLQFLQNPKDCTNAKKLVCNLNKACGYGCQIHHVVYCFIFAYATQRTMLLQSTAWRYHKNGWNAVFQPISQNCTTKGSDQKSVNWPGNPDAQVINLAIIDSLQSKPAFLPLTVPEDLNIRLRKVHGNPIVWWIGQLMKYLLKPIPELDKYLNDLLIQIGFQKPIVGVHIRRTDKIGSEASFHNIEEYMQKVDEYYDRLEMAQFVRKRRVFIATDDPKVLNEAQNKYPSYEILGNTDIAKSAAIFSRYSNSSLHGIIFDIHALSLTDYLVCTFSSQVCRMAYELMQNYHIDASEYFQSLDDIYYYGGQNAHNVVAVLPHKAMNDDEIDLEIGDLIGIEGNHWNGYSKGLNRRSNKQGLFPSFKVLDRIETFAFPTYPQVSDLV